ncbi:tRNA-splicing endonuclease subunit Sen15 isoform X2 [Stegostoma tigrinum]|uniref:tRNA-splicing endonuclease subunit Sen15 isoform X2 n=1 Tax=Stegostoma tigrinum TaxID=3053191 RepID=UPI00202AF0CF|nr:tRNA-splicing endonuclease subunit Sen15 isoform X2 [Stegostoma tigrinum]
MEMEMEMDVAWELNGSSPSPGGEEEEEKEEQEQEQDEEELCWRRSPPPPRHHPKYTEMMALDIADSTQVYTAFLVLLDLLEARNWKDVAYKGSEELQLVYLQGCPGGQEEKEVVVPMPVHMTLSHESENLKAVTVRLILLWKGIQGRLPSVRHALVC